MVVQDQEERNSKDYHIAKSYLTAMAKQIGGIDVHFTESNRNFHEWWIDYKPSVTVLPRGWQREPDRLALKEDLVWEKDVDILLRDGVKLRADVFRPAKFEGKPLPALLPWSPYGKTGSGKTLIHNSCLNDN